MKLSQIIEAFVMFWTVIDPIGTIPVYLSVVGKVTDKSNRKVAVQCVFIAAVVLLIFFAFGQFLFQSLKIPLAAFQISGGIVLFLFSLTMVFGNSKPEDEIPLVKKAKNPSVYPLAIPSIAGPGSMLAVVLIGDAYRHSYFDQIIVASILLVILIIQLLFLLGAHTISHYIGETGASVISRIMGLILGAVAANHVLLGISTYFRLPHSG